jgi:HK97 family phage major capsid protein
MPLTAGYLSRTDALSTIVEQRAKTILGLATETSVALGSFRQVPVSTKTLKMQLVASFPTAKWLMPATAPEEDVDLAKKPTSDMTWTDQNLTVEEAAVIVIIPENVVDDSEINLWTEVESRCAEAIAVLVDMACFFGVAPAAGLIPASFPVGGIFGRAVAAANEVQQTTAAGPMSDPAGAIDGLFAKVEADGYDCSHAYSGVGVRSTLRNLRDKNNALLYSTNLVGNTPTNSVWGVPISYVTNGSWDATKSLMLAGDPNMAVIGMRQGLTAKRLDQATIGDINLAERDALALRVKIRLGFTIIAPKGVATPAGAFPFATLKPGLLP